LSTKILGRVGAASGLRVDLPAGPAHSRARATRARCGESLARLAALLLITFGTSLGGCKLFEDPEAERGALIEQAAELLGSGKAEEAVELLRPIASRRALDPEISLLYGRALVQNMQASLAIWPLERATNAIEAPEGARALFIQALFLGGAARDSIREATRFLEENPDHAVVRRLRADAYEANLQLDDALADLDYLIESDPRNPRILEAKLDLLTKAERFAEAHAVIGELRVLMDGEGVEPEVAGHFCAAAARFELDRGRAAEALEQIDACRERFASDPTVLLSRVEILDGLGRDDEATRFLEEIGPKLPSRLRIQFALATRLAERDRFDQAEAVLRSAATTVGGAQPLLALADLRVARRDFAGAAEAVLEGIRNELGRGPGDADFEWGQLPDEALFAFGDLFISAEDYDHAEQIVPVVRQDSFRLFLKARLALARDDPKTALADYEEGFRIWPANSGARYLAGVAAMKLGEFDRATSFYQDALRSDAKANDAGLVLARMLIAQGYPGAAMDTLGFYVRENEDELHAIRLFATAAMSAGAQEYAENARAKLAENLDWAGIAMADHARDIARIGGLEAAKRYLERSPQLELPTHFEALWAWAEIEDRLGQPERVARRIESLARKDPSARGPALNLGRLHAKAARLPEARAILEPLARAHPEFRAAQLDLGKVLAGEGEIDAALDQLDRADRLDPLEPEASELACFVALDAKPADVPREAASRRCESFLARHPWDGRVALRLARERLDAGDTGDRTVVLARQATRFIASSGKEAWGILGQVLAARGESKEAVDNLARAVALGIATPRDRLAFARGLAATNRAEDARRELEDLLETPTLERADADAARTVLAGLAAD